MATGTAAFGTRRLADRLWIATPLLEVGLVALLFLAALAVRLPYLWSIPEFTDETLELLRAWDAYRSGQTLLVGTVAYIGVLHAYLLMLGWSLLGREPLLGRALSLLLGAATVPAAYWLGREVHSRAAGLAVAALVGLSGFHVLLNSHVGWSNSLTPFFTTLACAALARAVRLQSGRMLALCGLLFGLALQTHLLAGLLLPGAAAYLAWQRPRLLRSSWLLVGALLFVAATATFVLYNLQAAQSGERATLGGILSARARRVEQADSPLPNPLATSYLDDLVATPLPFGLIAAGIVPTGPPSDTQVAYGLGYLALALVALAQQARRGAPLPALVALPALALLPAVNGSYFLPFTARYFVPIAILLDVALAGLLADLAARLARPPRPWLAPLAALALCLPAALGLLRYERVQAGGGDRSAVLLSTVDWLQAHRGRGELLVVDSNARRRTTLGSAGDQLDTLTAFLAVAGIPFKKADVGPQWLAHARASGDWPRLAILSCEDQALVLREAPATAIALDGRPPDRCFAVGLVRFDPPS